jgi:hypothetical protein
MTNVTRGWSDAPRRRWTAVLAGAVTLAGALLVGGAAPASAEVPGHQMVEVRGAYTSGPSQTVTAECPPGKELIGVGASVSGNGVVIRSITPDLVDEEVVVSASETPTGAPFDWRATAEAVCASAGTIPDRYLVEETDTVSANETYAGAIADCDAGDRTLGLGFRSSAPAGRVMPASMLPTEDSAQAVLHEDVAGLASAWNATTVALCGGGVSAFIDWHQSPSPTSTSDTMTCDSGTTVVGGGGLVVHPTSSTGYFAISSVNPGRAAGFDLVTTNGREMTPTASVPEVYAYAICADLV